MITTCKDALATTLTAVQVADPVKITILVSVVHRKLQSSALLDIAARVATPAVMDTVALLLLPPTPLILEKEYVSLQRTMLIKSAKRWVVVPPGLSAILSL
jgi:hypothetical protein